VILAVRPDQLSTLAGEIKDDLENQLVISTITGATILKLQGLLGADVTIARSMPNIGIKTGNSMTCLAFDEKSLPFKEKVESIFNALGKTLIISENNFAQATVLCGSGIAIIAKFARAYMQAGIQNGFSEHDALAMAIQVLKGTVSLLEEGVHPEVMIDKVTTPGGCTISTLVEMEHQGFASSLLKSVESGVAKAKTL
jgi:pyrroline-5-carboxylate reductase